MLIWKVETAIPTDRNSREFHDNILLSPSLPPGAIVTKRNNTINVV